jgi:predicted Zn-dependent protease
MNRYNRRLLVIWIVIFTGFLFACSRKLTPSNEKENGQTFDRSGFNYYYVEGISEKFLGNSGDAIRNFEQAILINNKSDAAYYQIAQILCSSGDISNGKRYLKRAVSLANGNMWYLTMMADIYYQEKNIDSAIYYYENAVKYFPEKEELQLTLGSLYSEGKMYDKAVGIFNSFDQKYGLNERSTVAAVKALMEDGKYDLAEEKVKALIKEFPEQIMYSGLLAEIFRSNGETEKAKSVYTSLLENNPENPAIQLAICDFLISQKDYNELFLVLNNVIFNQRIKREDKIGLFARITENEDIVKKKCDDLIIDLMVLEATYKEDNVVPLLRADLLVKTGKIDEAEQRLEEIIKKDPENYYAWEKLLLAYNQDKEYELLFKRGEECATKFNRSFLAKVLFANAAMELKKFDVAIEELRKAEILAGNSPDFIIQVLTMRADVYYRMKEYGKAFETFREALKQNNDDLTVINNYAYYLAEQNQNLKEAELMAKMVIEKEKNNPTYMDTYAWVLYKRGKFREAEKVMSQIMSLGNPADAEYYEHYGYIFKKLHQCQKATEYWNNAVRIDSTKLYLKEEIINCIK